MPRRTKHPSWEDLALEHRERKASFGARCSADTDQRARYRRARNPGPGIIGGPRSYRWPGLAGNPLRRDWRPPPTVERMRDGAYEVSDIINGARVHKKFYGYTQREALARFKDEFLPREDRPRRHNPELLIVNPYHNPGRRRKRKGGVMRVKIHRRYRSRMRNCRSVRHNPALYKKVRGRYVSYGERVRKELAKIMKLRHGKYKSFKFAMPLARKRALEWLKGGVVYHQGLRLKVVGTKGYIRSKRRKRRKKGSSEISHFKAFARGGRRRAARKSHGRKR